MRVNVRWGNKDSDDSQLFKKFCGGEQRCWAVAGVGCNIKKFLNVFLDSEIIQYIYKVILGPSREREINDRGNRIIVGEIYLMKQEDLKLKELVCDRSRECFIHSKVSTSDVLGNWWGSLKVFMVEILGNPCLVASFFSVKCEAKTWVERIRSFEVSR